MEFIDFLRQMDRVCENSDHCQNCPLKPFPCNDDIASIARNVDDQTLREMEDVVKSGTKSTPPKPEKKYFCRNFRTHFCKMTRFRFARNALTKTTSQTVVVHQQAAAAVDLITGRRRYGNDFADCSDRADPDGCLRAVRGARLSDGIP